jgi:putative DNA primase/helicase
VSVWFSRGLTVSPTLSDLDALGEAVRKIGAKLVIVDTLPDFFGSGSLLDPQAVRRVLSPLAALAKKLDFAVILVRHFTKTGKTTMSKGAGSTAIAAVSRSGLFIVKDPDNDSRRVLACYKHNLIPGEPAALVFRLVTANDVGRVKWVKRSRWTAETLLAASMENETAKGARREAEDFLQLFLQDGSLPAKDVMEAGEANGHTRRTLERARKKLGVVAERRGGLGKSGTWYLRLPSKAAKTEPSDAMPRKNGKDRQSKSGGLRTPPLSHIDTRPRFLLLPRI